MTNDQFLIEVENSHNRSKKVLIKKEKEYSPGADRLDQFYRAATLQRTNPCSALFGMAIKHITSIADMCKDPTLYNLKTWDEKIGDLRNYTYLLDALLRDMEVK